MKADRVIGGLLIVFGAIMFYEAGKLPEGTFGTLGAAFFPKILFVLSALAGAALILGTFLNEKNRKTAGTAAEKETDADSIRGSVVTTIRYHKNVILAFIVFFGYVILMYYFGYPIATVIFMPVLMWILGPRNKRATVVIIATTIGVTFIIHYSFLKILKIFLPAGTLF